VGIRQTLNDKPAIAYGVVAALFVIAGGALFFVMRGGSNTVQNTKPVGDQGFYTDDDGKTWFADDLQKATPFKHYGKDAVRAMVYRCSDGKAFCAYMVRHTDLGRQQTGMMLVIGPRPMFGDHALNEIKKPNAPSWLPVENKTVAKVNDVMAVSCPGNANDVPSLVFPGQE